MHISDIKDLKKFKIEQLGKPYYSVGPLQPSRGIIEEWTFTDDKYDQARLLLGNFFLDEDQAKDFFHYTIKYYQDKP